MSNYMLNNYKIPIIAGRNDIPTTSESQSNHPNGSFTTKKFNDLIDNELIPLKQDLEEVIENQLTVANVRSSISVTGNGSYNSATGVININNNASSVINPLSADLFINPSSPTNGNGTQASPFNSVASLVARLNSSRLISSFPSVRIIGDVNFQDLIIQSALTTNKDYNGEFGYLYFVSDNLCTITLRSVSSNIPLNFLTPVKIQGVGTITVTNSDIVADDITGPLNLVNSSLQVKNLTNSTVTLFNSHLTLLDGVATNVNIEAVQSTVTVKNINTPISTSGIDNLFVQGKQSSIAIIDSNISNDKLLLDCLENSSVRLVSTIYQQVSTEGFSKVLTDNSCTYYEKNCTGFSAGEPYNAIFKVLDGVVV